MHWNHRVVKRISDGEEYFGIHEMFYDNPEETEGIGWTKNAVPVTGESVEELRETLERMLKSLDRPVIEDITVA